MAKVITWYRMCFILKGLEVLNYNFVEFLDNQIFLFVKTLNLWDLLVFFEVFWEFIKSWKEICYHLILFIFTGIS
jgi:hypothetical protein